MASSDSSSISLSPVLARCLEIARECLAGDPMREVPALEAETDRLAYESQGRTLSQADVDEACAHGYLPAHLVADNALGLACDLADDGVANG